ncbi:MAG: hypothetical protein LC114_19765, partial [Bryobacterales bacterium]|nr:hypothetical protein [Bryobacterales bacterium]
FPSMMAMAVGARAKACASKIEFADPARTAARAFNGLSLLLNPELLPRRILPRECKFNNQQISQITAARCNNIESLKANTGLA